VGSGEGAFRLLNSELTLLADTLIRDDTFRLPGKKTLTEGGQTPRVAAVDVTESPIECPIPQHGINWSFLCGQIGENN